MLRGQHNEDASQPRRMVLIRTLGVGLGVVLTAVAMWLIVTSTTQKSLEIGVLLGIWGVVIAAACALSYRAAHHDASAVRAAARDSGDAGDSAARSVGEVVPIAQLAESRVVQAHLEQILRSELRTVLGTEVERLRAEVADLRKDINDTLGGHVRLERVETTRVIGSNLETMHQQLQRLTADEPTPQEINTVDAEIVDAPAVVPADRAAYLTEAADEPESDDSAAPDGGGGRRRAENAEDDVLARILAREHQRPRARH